MKLTSFIQALTESTWPKACRPEWLSEGPKCPYGAVVGPPMGTFTWPHEDARSWIHYAAAFYSVAPTILAFGFPVLFLFTRGLRELLAIAFFWLHKCVMWGLKDMAAQRRPVGSCIQSCGMPSGHSMDAASFLTWFVLEVALARSIKSTHKALYIVIACVILGPVAWSRVFFNDHSVAQVVAGTAVGIACGSVWYLLLQTRVTRLILKIISLNLPFLHANYPVDPSEEEAPWPRTTVPEAKKR